MKFNFIKNYTPNSKDTLTIFIHKSMIAKLNNLDILKNTSIDSTLKSFDFEGKEKQILELKAFAGLKKLIIVGLGDKNNNALTIGGACADYLSKDINAHVLFLLETPNKETIENILLGLSIKSWGFDKYLSNEDSFNTSKLETINLIDTAEDDINLNNIKAQTDGVFLAKSLVNEPANILYPATYVEQIKELESLGVIVEVLDRKKLIELKMTSFLSVTAGSDKEPYVVVLKYMNGTKNKSPLAFVGKGVTYDTGGYSLKPAGSMLGMKKDMAGSAAVVGLMKTLATRKAKVNAIGVVGLVENMVNGSATRPGDIVTAMNGKTIEVLNTDAEGRMVLADILHYASSEFKPSLMINLATLTGAMIVALGSERGGLFANNQELADNLLSSGLRTGELLWQMPLSDEYAKHLKSNIADLQNISMAPRVAGSIFAGMFLKEFVNETTWAHLDIAGVADVMSNSDLHKKGATAFGVRLLNDLVANYYED